MRCKKYEERIILYLYGELSEKEKAEVESHIQECAECAQDLAYTQKVFQALDEAQVAVPEANWEKCWKRIDSGIPEKPKRKKSFLAVPQWAYAAAGLLAVLVVGIIIGRFWFAPGEKAAPQPAAAAPASSYQPILQEFIEDLKPILVEYANYSDKEKDTVVMDREFARSLILQNLLLKKIVSEKDPSALQFLEDVDIILKEISNLKRDDKHTPALIKDFIDQRGVLFKMEILQKI